jgi:DNA polymerase-3 subunit gamma/tau
MDQAIASAPVEDGRARLDAAQIRELMGTVPNAMFETIFSAVNNNRSAEVMSLANQLLDAGNSPAQLARQCVRYLRNCLIAKIAGIGSDEASDGVGAELLQISVDEQRRAGRTAALFTEEELTRFLQMMLRTFDELGYRQEQRFHFELGLLKLVHLRRLLPVEELLSQFPAASPASASGTGGAAPRVAGPSVSGPTPTPPAATRPVFSPFEQSKKRFDEPAAQATVKVTTPVGLTMAASAAPAPVMPPPVVLRSIEVKEPVAPVVETAKPAAIGSQDVGVFQKAVVEALQGAGKQGTAADAFDDAEWTVEGGELRVQMLVSKAMLPMVVNPEAEKIARAALRENGAGALKLVLLPGSGATAAAVKKPRAAKVGSAEDLAAKHPVVQEAQRLFNAEIRNVIDLRDAD